MISRILFLIQFGLSLHSIVATIQLYIGMPVSILECQYRNVYCNAIVSTFLLMFDKTVLEESELIMGNKDTNLSMQANMFTMEVAILWWLNL